MNEFKVSGHCTLCDCACFEVMQVFEAHELYPGEPKRLGQPIRHAMRITFMLFDGTRTDMTFCRDCAVALSDESFTEIWRKNLRSWQRELKGATPDWFKNQFYNGMLCEVARRPWTEVIKNG